MVYHHVVGTGAIQESILVEVEKRQGTEREILLELIAASQADSEAKQMAASLRGEVRLVLIRCT